MSSILTIQSDLGTTLKEAGIDVVDKILPAGLRDGRAWVLLGSYAVGDETGMELTVIVAVSPGHDLAALILKAWDAIYDSSDFSPLGYSPAYGSVPIAGLNAKTIGDWASIDVVSNRRI